MFQKLKTKLLRRKLDYARSYAQCGEDLIVDYVLKQMGIETPFYIDIGANHPRKLNNTYSFYRRGACGVLVEANPDLASTLASSRPRDKVLQCAIAGQGVQSVDLYVMNNHAISTTDAEQAKRIDGHEGFLIKDKVSVRAMSINELFADCAGRKVDFCSLDIEANMADLIGGFDFEKFRPSVWCVETLFFDPNGSKIRDWALIDLFLANGYVVYADTVINSIFVPRDWQYAKDITIINHRTAS